jgi:hypothetical protein
MNPKPPSGEGTNVAVHKDHGRVSTAPGETIRRSKMDSPPSTQWNMIPPAMPPNASSAISALVTLPGRGSAMETWFTNLVWWRATGRATAWDRHMRGVVPSSTLVIIMRLRLAVFAIFLTMGCVVAAPTTGSIQFDETVNLGYSCAGGLLSSWVVSNRETQKQGTATCQQPVLFHVHVRRHRLQSVGQYRSRLLAGQLCRAGRWRARDVRRLQPSNRSSLRILKPSLGGLWWTRRWIGRNHLSP